MLSAIYGEQFFHDCYSPLGEVIVKLNISLENTMITYLETKQIVK